MPPVKKQARPRIDAIVRHIKAGSFDDEIEQIKAAMDERNKARQEAVLLQVKKVFGKQATVEIDHDPDGQELQAQPRRVRPRPGRPVQPSEEVQLPPELAAAERAARQRERELEAEVNSGSGGDPDDPEAEMISNSPLIGAIATE